MLDEVRTILNRVKTAVDTHGTDWMSQINTIPEIEKKSAQVDHLSMVLERARCNTVLFNVMKDAVHAKTFADSKARQIISNMISQWMIYASLLSAEAPESSTSPETTEQESVTEKDTAKPQKKKAASKRVAAKPQKKKAASKRKTAKPQKKKAASKRETAKPQKRKSTDKPPKIVKKPKALARCATDDTKAELISMLEEFVQLK